MFHGVRSRAAITAKQNDAVIGVNPVTGFLDECVPKKRIIVRILPLVKEEKSDTLPWKSGVNLLETLCDYHCRLRRCQIPRMMGEYESRWHLIANMGMQQIQQCGLSATRGPSNLWKRLLSHGRRNQCKIHTWTSLSLSNISYNRCTVSDRGLQKAKKDGSSFKDVWINLIHSREIDGTDSFAGGIDTC